MYNLTMTFLVLLYLSTGLLSYSPLAHAGTVLNPEPIRSFAVENNQMSFTVKSSGCTTKDNFRLLFDDITVTLVKTNPDRCKKMPHWKNITFDLIPTDFSDWPHFYIANPVLLEND